MPAHLHTTTVSIVTQGEESVVTISQQTCGKSCVVVTVSIRHHHGSTGCTYGSPAPTLARPARTTVAGIRLPAQPPSIRTIPILPDEGADGTRGRERGKRRPQTVSQSQSSRGLFAKCGVLIEELLSEDKQKQP